jgi:hypothetical protein
VRVFALLLSCGDRVGSPGSKDCTPFPVGHDCSIWECWWVQDGDVVAYQYEWGWGYDTYDFAHATDVCHSAASCGEQAQRAATLACPSS